jgi:7-carboxy-7-deazaguanine synthase
MKVCEIFLSIQGEGVTMGLPTSFVRLTGCNLRCKWCDTAYAYEEGEEMSIADILAKIRELGCQQVCVTGGEPLCQSETPKLVDHLISAGFMVTLETNGSVSIEALQCSDNLMISLDVKCPSSGEDRKMDFSNIELLSPNDQLKFIIDGEGDYEYAKGVIEEHESLCHIVMIPVGGRELEELTRWVLEDNLKIRVLPQLHKIIWGDRRRK